MITISSFIQNRKLVREMPNVVVKGGQSLDSMIGEILNSMDATVMIASKDAAKIAADSVVKELKATSPKGARGAYAGSWKAKAEGNGQVVFNEKHYRLTHLLEKGHDVIVNGRKVGRAPAYPHIKQAEDTGIKKFEDEVRKDIERRMGR